MADPPDDRTDHGLHVRLRAIVTRLCELQQRFERAQDSRAIFAYIYATITAEVDEHLDRMGLVDPAWIVALAERFADRYFAAVEAFDAGEPTSRAWRAVFDTGSARSSVLEDAVFPMTVHIVHDLPLALLDAGFDAGAVGAHLHDFDQINRVMEISMDRIRRGVTRRYSPGLRCLDRMERHYDVVLSSYGIRMSRSQAWYDALRLRDPTSAAAARRSLETRPVQLIDSVRRPADSWIGPLLFVLRVIASLFRRWPKSAPTCAPAPRSRRRPRRGSPG